MKYYLKKYQQDFYDGHGSPDEGEKQYEVVHGKNYDVLKEGAWYEDNEEWDGETPEEEFQEFDEEKDRSAMDGYNSEEYSFGIKEITEEQAQDFKERISKYEELDKIF